MQINIAICDDEQKSLDTIEEKLYKASEKFEKINN